MIPPTFTVIANGFHGMANAENVRLMISGGEIAPEWAKDLERYPQGAECEISIWRFEEQAARGRVQIGSCRGTVWPPAWPEFFESFKGSAQTGPYTLLTAKAIEAVRAAMRAAEGAQS